MFINELRYTKPDLTMNRKDFESLDRMINFIRTDLRHCIGVDANWVVALAVTSYTETFGHFLPNMHSAKNYQCYNEFLSNWMNYNHLIDPKKPYLLYDEIRNGLAHEYLLKADSEVNMGTGPCGIEIIRKRKSQFIRFNIVTYYNDFMEAIKKYRLSIKTNISLQNAFDVRMKGKSRLK
jgi:hypothetical protein